MLEQLEPVGHEDPAAVLTELRRAAALQLELLAELMRWAGDLTAALNANMPRRYGVSITAPRFPAPR
jgi:hypothetical protein